MGFSSILYPAENQKRAMLEGIEVMCRIFWGPNPDLCIQMIQGNFLSSFEALNAELNYTPPDAMEKFKAIIGTYSDSNSLFDDLEEDYVRLFISDRDGVIAPLYQSCYEFENAPLMGSSAIQMKDRLEAKGLNLADHLNEPPDHLCIELEFLYFVMQKGWEGEDDAYIKEGSVFAGEMMFPWVDTIQKRIAAKHPYSFYDLAASILCALLLLIARTEHA